MGAVAAYALRRRRARRLQEARLAAEMARRNALQRAREAAWRRAIAAARRAREAAAQTFERPRRWLAWLAVEAAASAEAARRASNAVGSDQDDKMSATATPTTPTPPGWQPTPEPTPAPKPVPTPDPSTPEPSNQAQPPKEPTMFPPPGYRDPADIPQIRAAVEAGGHLYIPHRTSVLGLRLVEWGSAFTADSASPGMASYAEGATATTAPPGLGSPEKTVRLHWGPFYLIGSRTASGEIGYEVGLRLAAKQALTGEGTRVTFYRSLSVSGSGRGWLNRVLTFRFNYLDYTAQGPAPHLPANSASAGWYVRVAPWRITVVVSSAFFVYLAYQAITTPLPQPGPVLP